MTDQAFLAVVNDAAQGLAPEAVELYGWSDIAGAEPAAPVTWRAAYLRTMAALRRGRELQRLSQADVADRLGVHMRTLRRWENGEGDPPAQVLFRWSEIVGVSIGANLPHRPGA